MDDPQSSELVGKVDRVAERAAEHTSAAAVEGGSPGDDREVELSGVPAPETGRGDTVTLTGDAKRDIRLGEEIAVRLPDDAGEQGWSYEIEGDYNALDVYERAQVIAGGTRTQAPGASGGSQFLVRAARKGKATVCFAPVDRSARDRAIRLKLKVK